MATGGTGGHIYPAIATAKELQERGHGVLLLGQQGGMEERVSAEQHIPFVGVEAGKLARSGQGKADPRELLRAGRGVLAARRELQQRGASAVVGFGGFASLPGILAGQLLGLPTVLHEQNARLGLTQRLAVTRAKAVGTAYPEVIGLAHAKAHYVGMPTREEKMLRAEARRQLGLQEGPLTILVMGGSQGSLALNNAVPAMFRSLLGREGLLPDGGTSVQVIHSTGPRWLGEVAPKVKDLEWYKAVGYVDAVAAWSAADLAITRAGTGTIAEAAYHGVPLIMVPLPESAENHQFHNAMSVQRAGAGQTVEQAHMTEELGRAVLQCAPSTVRTRMSEAASHHSPIGAAARFADLIERSTGVLS